MSNNIVSFVSIADEIRIGNDGVAYVSIRGAARICGIHDSSIRRTAESAALDPSKLAQTLINYGFDAAAQNNFSTVGIPDQALAIIIKYYATDAGRYCTDQAKAALDFFLPGEA